MILTGDQPALWGVDLARLIGDLHYPMMSLRHIDTGPNSKAPFPHFEPETALVAPSPCPRFGQSASAATAVW